MRSTAFVPFALLVASLVPTLGAPAGASKAARDLDVDRRPQAPHFELPPGTALEQFPLLDVTSDIQIVGPIATVRIQQTWENRTDATVAARYVFPASTAAAVHELTLRVGERTIRAELQERTEARKSFERGRREGRTSALLEQERPNVLAIEIGELRAGEVVRVDITYSELLVPDGGVYELVAPQVVGPRFGGDFGDESGIWRENPMVAVPTWSWSANVDIRTSLTLRSLSSPSHQLRPQFGSKREASMRFQARPGEPGGDRDLILRFRLDGDQIQAGAMLHRAPRGEDSTFLIQIEPPESLVDDDIPPRDVVFIMDVSGSMLGGPLEASKTLMRRLLDDLRPIDSFNVLVFAGASVAFSERSVMATADQIERAWTFLNGTSGGGSTYLQRALDTSFALPTPPGTARSLVILTDGFVLTDVKVLQTVRDRIHDAAIHAVGVGPSPNRFLIEGLAKAGRTSPLFLTRDQEAPRVAEELAERVRRVALTDITVSFDGFDAFDLAPAQIPDLVAHKPIVVLGRFRGPTRGTATLTGRVGDRVWRRSIALEDNAERQAHAPIVRLWARERIRDLADFRPPTLAEKKQILDLAFDQGLMTQFTSFVAVDSRARPKPAATGSRPGADRSALDDASEDPRAADRRRSEDALRSLGLSPGAAVSNALPPPSRGSDGARKRKTVVDFSDATIEGDLTKPEGAYIRNRRSWEPPSPIEGMAPRSFGAVGYGKAARRSASSRAKPSIDGPIIYGSLEKESIQRVVGRHVPALRRCYETELKASPQLELKVVVKILIGEDGLVREALVRQPQSPLLSEAMRACVESKARTWRFPKPRGGGKVIVEYPFSFTPR